MMLRPKIISGLSLIAIASAIFYVAYRAHHAVTRQLQLGQVMPSFRLHDVNGTEVTERVLSGRSYCLIFFRTDCEHCRQELIEIDKLLPQFAGRLPLFAVSLNSAEETRRVREQWRLTMATHVAPVDLAQSLNVRSVPLLILVGGDGRISYVQKGERSRSFQEMVFNRFLQGESLAEADLRKLAQGPAAVSPSADADCECDIPKER